MPWSRPRAEVRRRLPPSLVIAASVACVAFGVWVASGMERWTIDSAYPRIGARPGVFQDEGPLSMLESSQCEPSVLLVTKSPGEPV